MDAWLRSGLPRSAETTVPQVSSGNTVKVELDATLERESGSEGNPSTYLGRYLDVYICCYYYFPTEGSRSNLEAPLDITL